MLKSQKYKYMVRNLNLEFIAHKQLTIKTRLKIELEDLLVKEEILWRPKSRESWLTCKDLNTKFFYTSTLIKWKSNAVDFLKTESSAWFSDRVAIGGSYCFSLFKSFIFL